MGLKNFDEFSENHQPLSPSDSSPRESQSSVVHIQEESLFDLEKLKISLSSEALKFLQKSGKSELYIHIHSETEPCLLILEPKVQFKPDSKTTYFSPKEIHTISLNFSAQFFETFQNLDSINISVKGLLKKRLEIVNIEPILINTCQIKR